MRLFTAVSIPAEIRAKIHEIGPKIANLGKFKMVEQENIHITLKFIGEVDDAEAKKIWEDLPQVNFEPFTASIKGLGVFPNENFVKVVWAGVGQGADEITQLNDKINQALNSNDPRFHPHATIARAKFVNDKKGLAGLLRSNKDTEFGAFEVGSFELMESRLSPQGPSYHVLRQYK